MSATGLLVVAALCAALVGACGSRSAGSTDLRHDARAVCAQANRALDTIVQPRAAAASVSFLREGIASLSLELHRLRAVAASGDDAPVYQAALAALSHQLSDVRRAATAITAGQNPIPVFRGLEQRLKPLEAQANDAWQALEIPSCGE